MIEPVFDLIICGLRRKNEGGVQDMKEAFRFVNIRRSIDFLGEKRAGPLREGPSRARTFTLSTFSSVISSLVKYIRYDLVGERELSLFVRACELERTSALAIFISSTLTIFYRHETL